MDQPTSTVETPQPDLYPLYIDKFSCFVMRKILFLWSEFLPFGIFINESKDSIFPNRKYILLIWWSFLSLVGTLRVQPLFSRRWQERIPHLSVAVVSICCDLRRGNWPQKGTQTNQSSYWSLSFTESETSILFTRYHSIPFYLRFGVKASTKPRNSQSQKWNTQVDQADCEI